MGTVPRARPRSAQGRDGCPCRDRSAQHLPRRRDGGTRLHLRKRGSLGDQKLTERLTNAPEEHLMAEQTRPQVIAIEEHFWDPELVKQFRGGDVIRAPELEK